MGWLPPIVSTEIGKRNCRGTSDIVEHAPEQALEVVQLQRNEIDRIRLSEDRVRSLCSPLGHCGARVLSI